MKKRMMIFIVLMLFVATPVFAGNLVKIFNGTGDRNTQSFKVDGKWQIVWASTAGITLGIFIKTTEGRHFDMITSRSGFGKSYFYKGGEFYLKVIHSKPWQIRIYDSVE